MADALELMGKSPYLTFLAVVLALIVIESILLRFPNRIMRHWNIHKHGYPPPHCDADGDFKEKGDGPVPEEGESK